MQVEEASMLKKQERLSWTYIHARVMLIVDWAIKKAHAHKKDHVVYFVVYIVD